MGSELRRVGHASGQPGRKITCVIYLIWARCVSVGACWLPHKGGPSFPVRHKVRLEPVSISHTTNWNESINQSTKQ